MATETDSRQGYGGDGTQHETFEDIDWDDEGGRTVLSRRDLGVGAVVAVLAAVFAYDYAVVLPNTPTVEFALPPSVPLFGDTFLWDVTQLDWLFLLTLVVMVFYVVVPLSDNRRLTAYYWRQFRKNRLAVVSLGYLVVVFLVGIVGPVFIPAPELELTRQYQPPLFTTVDSSVPLQCVGEVTGDVCHGSLAHPLGTTSDGKDILVLVIYGMQVSMKLGLITTLLVISIGTAVGTVAAYSGGMVDEALMRYVDIQLTFPTFLLYLLLVFLFGGSLFMFIVLFGLTSWGGIARLVRSEALQLREEEYVLAAKSAGANAAYVIRRHLVPNVSSTVITAATLAIPGYILAEAALSFLQLGDPTIPSWGQVIAAGRSDLDSAWWISTFPGFFLFFTILAFNFMGDALRDALDPRADR
ncbi:ABC transporter permease [Salinigranum halophilum]|jgi:peptide/nickel transport system permease protein|uniref:ABC transporter permease n=1 Tax=Salinigranum halophilum TaxID=2565931 RepID=UPI00115DA43E|nr:ABC transporter permease [Salinigranum halophilum]